MCKHSVRNSSCLVIFAVWADKINLWKKETGVVTPCYPFLLSLLFQASSIDHLIPCSANCCHYPVFVLSPWLTWLTSACLWEGRRWQWNELFSERQQETPALKDLCWKFGLRWSSWNLPERLDGITGDSASCCGRSADQSLRPISSKPLSGFVIFFGGEEGVVFSN